MQKKEEVKIPLIVLECSYIVLSNIDFSINIGHYYSHFLSKLTLDNIMNLSPKTILNYLYKKKKKNQI